MRYCIAVLFFALLSVPARSQDVPLYTHYYANPYIYNPAYAGIEGRPIVSLTHRQQWLGIEDAPVTSNLTFHMPVVGGFSMGLNVTQDNYGIFKSSTALLSVGYNINLGYNQYLAFGMSGGVGSQQIDPTGLDLSDPALSGVLDQGAFLDGNAGIAYHIAGLSIGVSLPNIFKTSIYPTADFDTGELGLIRNYMVTADYMIYFGNNEYIFQPYGSYRSFEGYSSQYEAGGIIHIKHLLWAGGSYRQDFGANFFLGVKLKSAFSVAYAYEMPLTSAEGINKTSHEIHLNLAFGKKTSRAKKYSTFLASKRPTKIMKKRKEPKIEPVIEDSVAIEEPLPEEVVNVLDSLNQGGNKIRLIIENEPPEKSDRIDEPLTRDSVEQTVPEVEVIEPAAITKKGGHPFELDKGHYIIVGAYGVAANAIRADDKLLSQGYDSDFGFSSDRNLFYVYILSENSAAGARQKRDELRKIPAFSKAWYLLVE